MGMVSIDFDDGVAVLAIDNPPVNVGNAELRRQLLSALNEVLSGSKPDGIVLVGGGSHFYSGSDLREFDSEISLPSLPEVVAAIENAPVCVVAALSGLAVGGGLELALACDVRVASTDAKLGLPEVKLGIIPGAGGTVRLPRLVGVPRAIEMISSGELVSATEAREAGLVDQVVDRATLTQIAASLSRSTPKRRVRDLQVPDSPQDAVVQTSERAIRGGRARPNVLRAIELVRAIPGRTADEALAAERQAFEELRMGPEARNLRYLFFAKRAAARDLGAAASTSLTSIGIAGAGTMGTRIAVACVQKGFDVTVFDVAAGARDRAMNSFNEGRGPGTVVFTDRLDDLRTSDLVIDAVFEDLEVKRDLLVRLDALTAADTVLASNTSYLNLDELGSALTNASRFAGVHFFNPADRNQLVEVVRTNSTSDRTMAVIARFVRTLQKTAILARVGEGFVANRVYAGYRSQAEFLVEEGASPRQVDHAMQMLGLPIGPFAVSDMSGLDIAWARRKRLAASRGARERYVGIADALCEAGRFGRKSGAGWYRYTTEAPRGEEDEFTAGLIDAARAAKGIVLRNITTVEIQQRTICAMVIAATEVVADGTARRASDVDVAMTEGFGFPKWLGGPVRYAALQPSTWVEDGLSLVRLSNPYGYASADVADSVPSLIDSVLVRVSDRT